jgi:branched-chain amino acid transport system permease protein
MTGFLGYLANGLSVGLTYALVVLGFVVIYRGTRVVNFAQGSLLVLGAYLTVRLQGTLGFAAAVVVSVAVTAMFCVVISRLLLRPLRKAPQDIPAILMIGVDIVLVADLTRRIGSDVLTMDDPWGSRNVDLGGVLIAQSRLAALVVSVLVIGAFLAVTKYTSIGLSSRAAAEDRETAALMGARLGRVSDFGWICGGGLAAIAGVFLVLYPSPGLVSDTNAVAILAFPAAIIGGLDSVWGALVGGLLVGLVQSFGSGYQSHIAFLGAGGADILPWILMVLVLLIKPTGLFGKQPLTRI